MKSLRVLLVYRAPVGGLFRQTLDLANYLIAQGHDVGIVADSLTGAERATKVFAELGPKCSLGIHRLPMHRNPYPSDLSHIRTIDHLARQLKVDVIHGHGSKGGLYARTSALFGDKGPIRVYTPHGGSFNYEPGTLIHNIYMRIEKILERGTDVFAFESEFIASRFKAEVGETQKIIRVALNGLHAHEFQPREVRDNATDLLYIGELRPVKGIDLLLESISRLIKSGRPATLTMVGAGPDEALLRQMVHDLGLNKQVVFAGTMSAHEAFTRARIMVVPSRFESLPYVVLEAMAAQIPLVTTNCGGIPEIVGDDYDWMIPTNNVDKLTSTIDAALSSNQTALAARAQALAARGRPLFDAEKMGADIVAAYRAGMAARPR